MAIRHVVFLVVVTVACVQGVITKLGDKCSSHTACTDNNSNSFCYKLSECTHGVCKCKSGYYVNEGVCGQAEIVEKGMLCTKGKDYQLCEGEGVVCTKCPHGGLTAKCRSKASSVYLSASFLLAFPAIYKLFF